jgi:hypothetical protein
MAPVPHPAGKFRLPSEAERFADFDEEGGGNDRPNSGFVTQSGAVLVEKTVEFGF